MPSKAGVPALTPRRPKEALKIVLKAHKFYVIVTPIWCAAIFILGVPIAIEGGGTALCFGLPFFIAAFWLVRATLGKIKRDRWLLSYGMLTRGEIVEHSQFNTAAIGIKKSTKLIWRFKDHLGRSQQSELETFDEALIREYQPGTRLEVLFDPRDVSRSTAPVLLRAEFYPPAEIEDKRVTSSEIAVAPPAPLDEALTLRIESLPMRARTGCLGLDLTDSAAGILEVTEKGLIQRDTGGEVVGQIDWARPFVVQRSGWLLQGGEAELGVTVVQRGGVEGRVRFEVELPQEMLSLSLPIQELNAPYLSSAEWFKLWPAIRFYAQLHGETLDSQPRAVQTEVTVDVFEHS